ncbi:Rv2732c family membrane protein [Nocardia paucivorans]|uniref:Rv2732c family membrane protein n=1 Tax=Nocardia paucivorans TaxID=114259 RepID=UPI0035716B5F
MSDPNDGSEPVDRGPGAADGGRGTGDDGSRRIGPEDESAESRETGADPEPPAPDNDSAEGNDDTVNPVEATDEFEQFRDDIEAVERRIAGEIDPGARALVVAVAVFVLLVSLVLPHSGGARGFDVLLGSPVAADEHIGLPSRIFVWFVVVFGIGFSLLALMTRRWVLAWLAVAGSAIAAAFGVFSIWHRQTPGLNNYVGSGPGIGLVLGTLAVMLLTFHWVRVVWSRTALQLAAEEQRRIAAAEEEERQRRRRLGED